MLDGKDETELVLTSGALDKNEKCLLYVGILKIKQNLFVYNLKQLPKYFSITDAQYLDDSNFILTKEDNKGNQVAGTLVANVVIEDSHYEGSKLMKNIVPSLK
ncbi:hypothetical protein AB6F55_17090 [Providencia hangzhouensis]